MGWVGMAGKAGFFVGKKIAKATATKGAGAKGVTVTKGSIAAKSAAAAVGKGLGAKLVSSLILAAAAGAAVLGDGTAPADPHWMDHFGQQMNDLVSGWWK